MPLLTAGPSRFLGGGAKWWSVPGATCVAAYQPKGAADLATSYVNLASPGTYNAAPGVAPALVAAGWSFTGTQWLTTGVLSAADMSMFVRFAGQANSPATTRTLIGSRDVSGFGLFIVGRNGSDTGHTYHYNGSVAGTPAMTAGVLGIAGANGYLDGVSQTSGLGNVIANPKSFYVGALNNNGGAVWFLQGTIQAIAIYATVLTAGDVAALTTRMQAL